MSPISNKWLLYSASPMPCFIWWSSMPCMAGTVHTQHLIRALSSKTALPQSQTCKKMVNTQDLKKRSDVTWALNFPEPRRIQSDSLVTQAVLWINTDLLTWDHLHLLLLPVLCQLSSVLQASSARLSALPCHQGDESKVLAGRVMVGSNVPLKRVVMWPDKKDVLRGQC